LLFGEIAMKGKWPAFVLVGAAIALGAAGCSPSKVDVTGRVTYNGGPLNARGGKIVFVGPDGMTQCEAAINADGTYRAVGVLAGLNGVAIFYPNPEFKPRKRPSKGVAPEEAESSVEPFLIPAKYASADTSEQSVRAAAGTVFNADLIGPEVP
jgi:hypothetical protein